MPAHVHQAASNAPHRTGGQKMSSLLTNNSAMVALQTLKTINKSLASTQDQISTGKRIATARDNAALWGISTTMSTDVTGFKAIGESLSLGSATLSVARDGAETISELLDQMKGKIVAAQEDNVDRAKIQADVDALRNQIITVVDAASFNGLNLLKGDNTSMNVSVLASLNRSATQTVSASNITFSRQSLEVGTAGASATKVAATIDAAAAVLTSASGAAVVASTVYSVGDKLALQLTNSAGQGVILSYAIQATDVDAAADTITTVFATAVGAFNTQLAAANTAGTFDSTGITLAAATNTITYADTAAQLSTVTTRGVEGGGLGPLALIDVSTKGGAKAALAEIETLIQSSITAAAAFGSAQGRIQTQSEYVSKIMDGLGSGIGALVDADMEEASAKLQALQVQQQLGIQALSIANQAPQNILALFR
jgi:flagellin